MAVNVHLVDRRPAGPDDLMGRTWYGWDPYASDQMLWNVNRGRWRLRGGAPAHRFATLSYHGIIRLVAEVTGRERTADQWALVGTVLRTGDPVHDELMGARAPNIRNPPAYFPTPELDALTTEERVRRPGREAATMLATWNPARWSWHSRAEDAAATEAGRLVHSDWSASTRSSGVQPGDRVFMLKQGKEPRGIVASGTCTSRIFQDTHWSEDRPGDEANCVLIDWDAVVTDGDLLPLAELIGRIPHGGGWRPQGSGTLLPPQVAVKLEAIWAEQLGQPPLEPHTGIGFDVRQAAGVRQPGPPQRPAPTPAPAPRARR